MAYAGFKRLVSCDFSEIERFAVFMMLDFIFWSYFEADLAFY
jgi:hypothetical protein